jgi:hydrogenase maturation protease
VAGKALIIGYGNPLRGDDGIGQVVAQHLTKPAIDDAEVVVCHQLTPELAGRLATVDMVVFIDAEAGATPPGSVTVSEVPHGGSALPSALAHRVDPAALLFMSQKLYGRSPQAFLVSVAARSFAFGEGLSDSVAAALPEISLTVRRLVATHLRERPSS